MKNPDAQAALRRIQIESIGIQFGISVFKLSLGNFSVQQRLRNTISGEWKRMIQFWTWVAFQMCVNHPGNVDEWDL